VLLLIELWDCATGDLRLCVRVCCSFWGGAGGCSTVGAGAFSPSGPKGPRESSKASSRTVCWPGRRGVRGCLVVGDLVDCAEVDVSTVVWGFGFGTVSPGLCQGMQLEVRFGRVT
jgi:hypothetical protein